jgi:hypothetical protein
MIKIIVKIIALGLYWSCLAVPVQAEPLKMDQDGNVLVQIIHSDGSVTCCCPASRMTSRGPEFTDLYCAIPVKEYNQWMIDLSGRKQGLLPLHCAPGYTCHN